MSQKPDYINSSKNISEEIDFTETTRMSNSTTEVSINNSFIAEEDTDETENKNTEILSDINQEENESNTMNFSRATEVPSENDLLKDNSSLTANISTHNEQSTDIDILKGLQTKYYDNKQEATTFSLEEISSDQTTAHNITETSEVIGEKTEVPIANEFDYTSNGIDYTSSNGFYDISSKTNFKIEANDELASTTVFDKKVNIEKFTSITHNLTDGQKTSFNNSESEKPQKSLLKSNLNNEVTKTKYTFWAFFLTIIISSNFYFC